MPPEGEDEGVAEAEEEGVALLVGAWPALSHFKLSFVTREIWNPVTEEFGALAAVYGTIITSLIAMVVAIPISFGKLPMSCGMS